MPAFGDLHRFGAQVSRIREADSRTAYLKPRSVLLEHLFLDSRAPSVPFRQFLQTPIQSKVECHGPWSGTSLEILETEAALLPPPASSELNSSPSYARGAGELLAIATLFGLGDLHSENIVAHRTSTELTPVPVDIEVAFWNCVSGIDTHLIPSQLTDPSEKSGFSAGRAAVYAPESPGPLLDAFLATSESISAVFPDAAQSLERAMQGHPIRVLLRPTREYRSMKIDSPLLPEERIQIDAGDIPYFFTERSARPRLLYFSKPQEISELDPGPFQKIFSSATPTMRDFIAPDRLSRLIKVTALHVVKAYFDSRQEVTLEGERFRLEISGRTAFLRTPAFSVQSKLT